MGRKIDNLDRDYVLLSNLQTLSFVLPRGKRICCIWMFFGSRYRPICNNSFLFYTRSTNDWNLISFDFVKFREDIRVEILYGNWRGRKGGGIPFLLETRHRLLTVNLFIQSADARPRYLTDGERS